MGVVVVGFEGAGGDVVAAADFLEGGVGFVGGPLGHYFFLLFRDEVRVGVELVDHMVAVSLALA